MKAMTTEHWPTGWNLNTQFVYEYTLCEKHIDFEYFVFRESMPLLYQIRFPHYGIFRRAWLLFMITNLVCNSISTLTRQANSDVVLSPAIDSRCCRSPIWNIIVNAKVAYIRFETETGINFHLNNFVKMHWFNFCMHLFRCIAFALQHRKWAQPTQQTGNIFHLFGACCWQQTNGTCSRTPIIIILSNTFTPLIYSVQKPVVSSWCPSQFRKSLTIRRPGVRCPDCSTTKSVWYDHFQHISIQMGSYVNK